MMKDDKGGAFPVKQGEHKLHDLIWSLRRNYPSEPSTFSACCKCHDKPARGGGLCAYCLQDKIAELVGEQLADDFHRTVREQALLINSMIDKVSEQ